MLWGYRALNVPSSKQDAVYVVETPQLDRGAEGASAHRVTRTRPTVDARFIPALHWVEELRPRVPTN